MFITGSRKGIGRALAEYFLKNGTRVLGCSRGSSDLEHENYTHYCCDVTDDRAVNKMMTAVQKTSPVVDVLINNAGGASMNHFLLTPTDSVRRLIELNYTATFTMSREMARLLKNSENGGRIVNFTTVAVALDLAGEAAYSASKGAVETLTRISAKELAPFGITVNAVGPTPIPTDLIAKVPENKLKELVSRQAIRRMGKVEDVINLVDFFIRPESEFITGQIIYLGGVL